MLRATFLFDDPWLRRFPDQGGIFDNLLAIWRRVKAASDSAQSKLELSDE